MVSPVFGLLTQLVKNAKLFKYLSKRRILSDASPLHAVLAIGVLELVANRVAVPMLRPATGVPPAWHAALDYFGLFAHYFVATLAAVVIFARSFTAVAKRDRVRTILAHVAVALAAALALVPLVTAVPSAFTIALEIVFAAAVSFIVGSGFGRGRDLGVQLGLVALAAPLLLHTLHAVGAQLVWSGGALQDIVLGASGAGVIAICLFALLSPYLLAPRPLVAAMTRPWPIAVAMTMAIISVAAVYGWYPAVARAATLATGVVLRSPRVDPHLALYLLALATLTWTVASCALATAEARRRVGEGIALLALGGYAFHWSHHYLMPLLGLAVIADAAQRVRDQELAGMPIKPSTPTITDAAWSSYLTAVKAHLEAALGASGVHALTTRGESGVQTSHVVAERAGIAIRTRIERFEGAVISLDIVAGHEFDERSVATLRLWAVQPRSIGTHPQGPPASPRFACGEASFDDRFRLHGDAQAFHRLFDQEVRAQVENRLDGWLAYWDRGGVRYRVYPGRGAPVDHPLPLTDLALGGPPTSERLVPARLVSVIALVLDIAERGMESTLEVNGAPQAPTLDRPERS